MSTFFPDPINKLPLADVPFDGSNIRLLQGEEQQLMFMEFSKDVDLAEHSHAAQWGIVLEGRIDLEIKGVRKSYKKGDRYFIPEGIKHSGKIFAGYADITFFDEKSRYKKLSQGQ